MNDLGAAFSVHAQYGPPYFPYDPFALSTSGFKKMFHSEKLDSYLFIQFIQTSADAHVAELLCVRKRLKF